MSTEACFYICKTCEKSPVEDFWGNYWLWKMCECPSLYAKLLKGLLPIEDLSSSYRKFAWGSLEYPLKGLLSKKDFLIEEGLLVAKSHPGYGRPVRQKTSTFLSYISLKQISFFTPPEQNFMLKNNQLNIGTMPQQNLTKKQTNFPLLI